MLGELPPIKLMMTFPVNRGTLQCKQRLGGRCLKLIVTLFGGETEHVAQTCLLLLNFYFRHDHDLHRCHSVKVSCEVVTHPKRPTSGYQRSKPTSLHLGHARSRVGKTKNQNIHQPALLPSAFYHPAADISPLQS
ncbi:hypothetical protein p1B62 (plasmid) [Aromatoleum aromaticum EbN1]|uniref:Uncharacterized protein n=1 Tax=Aromatoleum aromaticum (strain DSM 19018 / LMG 30748 / EbN1) TaxID=76114 RepID=Q5NXC4_AROAE|nr:hypothetical protein p1B62 [Aromatoleum aromaticum EbN1]